MISANGGLPAHRYTPQVTPRWPQGSEPASQRSDSVTRYHDAVLVPGPCSHAHLIPDGFFLVSLCVTLSLFFLGSPKVETLR